MSYHIEGRRWFQRTYGNTYHSVRIYKDGKLIGYIPYVYGYGEQFIETALQWLAENDGLNRGIQHSNGSWPVSGTYGLRENLGASYSVIDVQRQKDL